MKRKSTTEENPTMATANSGSSDKTECKKRRRLSNEDAAPAKDTKRSKQDKKERKEKKEKKHKKQSREEQAAALDAVYDEEAAPFGGKDQDQAMDDGDSKPAEKKASKPKPDAAEAVEGAAKSEKSKKKKKKDKKDKNSADESKSENPEEGAAATADGEEKTAKQELQTQENARPKKNSRFIVFVGNLPYSATVADIEQHFSAVHPTAVRLLHEKTNPNKSRGIAFVEFAGYDHMKTCLKTLHHSTMTCVGRDYHGKPKDDERKINVELTAGGGGNTDYRKERIRAKNEKLTGERDRRAKQEEIEKIKKEKERLLKGGAQKPDANGIHPSRMARVPKKY
ncbi:hypothetical protein PG996_005694 [Apiospora saccharicola]|uniref:RRM domain-containing protein n=1 Tax=Apiospora saccharicola TaxID=335842 RepID=A0ABR1VM73_9PEZI